MSMLSYNIGRKLEKIERDVAMLNVMLQQDNQKDKYRLQKLDN